MHIKNDTTTFRIYLKAKKKGFIPHVFLEILQRYVNFAIWVLWVCLTTDTEYDKINL